MPRVHRRRGLLLLDVFATADSAFAGALVTNLLNATARGELIDGLAAQAALSMVQAIAPRDEVEAMLAVQMAAIHNATMDSVRRLNNAEAQPIRDAEATILTKCTRTFAAQVETLKRHRSTGEQAIKVTHQHVHVADGG